MQIINLYPKKNRRTSEHAQHACLEASLFSMTVISDNLVAVTG